MATAVNHSGGGILSHVLGSGGAQGTSWSTTTTGVVAAAVVLVLLLPWIWTPRLDPSEPPLVKPTIPLIGHIIGLIQHQAKYHLILHRKTRRPIATLPMLAGKMYAVWDPVLVATALRTKSLSATPHIYDGSVALAQLSPATAALIRGPDGKAAIVDRVLERIMPPTLKGAGLERMYALALPLIGQRLGQLADGRTATIPNVWLWLRGLMMSAAGLALYGKEDPFAKDPGLEQAMWDFDADLAKLAMNFLPSIIAPKAHRARAYLCAGITPYYRAGLDSGSEASEFVRVRAREFRAFGMPEDEMSRLEIMLPFGAVANTVPSLFWFFGFVMSRPELVARLRAEIAPQVTRSADGSAATVSLARLEERCPLLTAAYRETLRLTNHQISTRTALEDTMLADGAGRAYLLCKGAVVQLSLAAGQRDEAYWGADVDEFRPERFLRFGDRRDEDAGPGSPRAIRSAFQPFGGGVHLCPGRSFAYTEMMAVMATMVLGFDVSPQAGAEWNLPPFAMLSLVDAVNKPAGEGKGFGVKVTRRKEWEGVQWNYEL